jgi:hypothetical protein
MRVCVPTTHLLTTIAGKLLILHNSITELRFIFRWFIPVVFTIISFKIYYISQTQSIYYYYVEYQINDKMFWPFLILTRPSSGQTFYVCRDDGLVKIRKGRNMLSFI